MNATASLTTREKQITELFAWGATKKEVARMLFISPRTVENHARNIYEKTGCTKVNELSAWWFCHRFCIPFTMSPLARKVVALTLLCIFSYGEIVHANNIYRRARTVRIETVSRSRRVNNDNYLNYIAS